MKASSVIVLMLANLITMGYLFLVAPSTIAHMGQEKTFTEEIELNKKIGLLLPKIYGSSNDAQILEIKPINNGELISVFVANGDHIVFNSTAEYGVLSSRSGVRVIDMINSKDITDAHRAQMLNSIFDEHEAMLISKPSGTARGTIYIGKDPQCGYCRKLDGEIDKIVDAGYQVKSYPLMISTGSKTIAELTYCSSEPEKTYSLLSQNIRRIREESKVLSKVGDPVVVLENQIKKFAKANDLVIDSDCIAPVDEISNKLKQIGFKGTPLIYTSTGNIIRGYKDATFIISQLEQG